MSDTGATPVSVPPVATELSVAAGTLYDASNTIVTSDPLASASFASDNPDLATITMNDDGLTATGQTTGAEGTFNVTGSGTTEAGVAVAGISVPVTVAPGPPVTFQINVTVGGPVPPPAPAPETPVVDPATNLPLYVYSGTDPVDTTAWTASTDVAGPNSEVLYTFNADTAGGAPTGVGGDWALFQGTPTPVGG